MILIPLINRRYLSFQLVVKFLPLIQTFLYERLLEILIIEIVYLALILLNKVLHSVERLDVPIK